MRDTQRKIKRVQPVINIKQTKVDEEAAVLNVIRNEKQVLVKKMKENQTTYMTGVERLNNLRNSSDRENLVTLEQSIDFVKSQWYQLFKQVQEIEQKEKAQISRLIVAETELRSAEKLKEKYEHEFRASVAKSEQKQMDEFALRKYFDK